MKKRITQQEIANRVGISQSYVSDLLNGHKTPSALMAARLERATGYHRLFWLYPREYTEEGMSRPPVPSTPHVPEEARNS